VDSSLGLARERCWFAIATVVMIAAVDAVSRQSVALTPTGAFGSVAV
jgi:hypothetical protein